MNVQKSKREAKVTVGETDRPVVANLTRTRNNTADSPVNKSGLPAFFSSFPRSAGKKCRTVARAVPFINLAAGHPLSVSAASLARIGVVPAA